MYVHVYFIYCSIDAAHLVTEKVKETGNNIWAAASKFVS